MMEADREVLCGSKGRHQIERPAWRGGSVQPGDTRRAAGRAAAAPRAELGWRSTAGELPMGGGHRPAWMSTRWAAVAAGVSTRRYAGTLDPVPADVTERATSSIAGVAAFRGAVDKAPLGISQPTVGRVGPAGGLHRRQGLPGPLHGDRVGDPRRRSPGRTPGADERTSDDSPRVRPAASGHAAPSLRRAANRRACCCRRIFRKSSRCSGSASTRRRMSAYRSVSSSISPASSRYTNVSGEGVSRFDDTRDVRRAQVDSYPRLGAAQ